MIIAEYEQGLYGLTQASYHALGPDANAMSSHDLILITPRQSPVINLLHDAMERAKALAAAIRDNAQEEKVRIPAELVASFAADYNAIISALTEAAS